MRPATLAALALAFAGCGGGGGDAPDADQTAADGGLDAGPDLSDELYDPAVVPDIRITLSPASIAALDADPATYVRGDLQIGDVTLTDIGVRLKGEYTFRPLSGKAAFKLKLDEFVDQRYGSLRRITLNSAIEDAGFVAERLAYTAFRAAGVSAPRANNARVYVNDELYGVYVNIEAEDKRFLARWHADDSGNLYEEQGVELLPGNEDGFELETNEATGDKADLTALFAAIAAASDDELDTALEAVLDVDQFLEAQALEGILDQVDGYAYTQFGPNNFRLYHEPATGLFTYIPWGMDMALKPYGGNVDLLDDATGLLIQRCLAGASCRARYLAIIRDMVDLVESLDLPAQADAMYAQIADLVAADPRKEITTEQFEETFAAERAFLVARPAEVRASLP